jgi:hypothetical protein
MYLTPDFVKAETAYRQERITRLFQRTTRKERAEQAARPEPRHARRALRPTTAP